MTSPTGRRRGLHGQLYYPGVADAVKLHGIISGNHESPLSDVILMDDGHAARAFQAVERAHRREYDRHHGTDTLREFEREMRRLAVANPFTEGDRVIHKDGGYELEVVWAGLIECKVTWEADDNFIWPRWRLRRRCWCYLPHRDLRRVRSALETMDFSAIEARVFAHLAG